MKEDRCKCEVRDFLSKNMRNVRYELSLSQMEFAEKLQIDRRSYLELEHGRNLCCTMTLLLYLIYCCKDPEGLLKECKKIFDKHGYS